jgi:hypothetical protein
LYGDTELANARRKTEGKQIWIVSSDLSNVVDKDVIKAVIQSNAKRGVTYTYIVPNSEQVRGVLPGLLNVLTPWFAPSAHRSTVSALDPHKMLADHRRWG